MRIIIATTLCLFLLPAFAGMGFADAPKEDITKEKPLPHYGMADEDFIAQSDLYEEMPYNDKFMEYRIRLPKEWRQIGNKWERQETNEESDEKKKDSEMDALGTGKKRFGVGASGRRVLGKIGKFFAPARMGKPSFIEISAQELTYDISSYNWFLEYALRSGYTLQSVEKINEKRVEALYIVFVDDTSYVIRTVAEINGPRMIMVSYHMPEMFWNKERAIQEKVIDSFELVSPEDKRIEVLSSYAFLDMFRFDYPSSWKLLSPNLDSVDSMDATLINVNRDETLSGEISIHAISTELDTTLAQEVGYVREQITERGFDIDGLLGSIDNYEINDFLFFSRVEVYEAPPRKGKLFKDHELWLAVMAEDRYYYIVTLLTPARNKEFPSWARNIAAFETVVETVRP